jgi:hypothetical protein
MWKKTLQDPKFQTHRDFFETLVKDVEGEHQGLDPNEKQNTNVDEFDTFADDLALDERICKYIFRFSDHNFMFCI